jgi:hypothetical protein
VARAYPGAGNELEVFEATGLLALHGFKALEQLRKVRLSLDKSRHNAQKELKSLKTTEKI